jgi:hypothetical protein
VAFAIHTTKATLGSYAPITGLTCSIGTTTYDRGDSFISTWKPKFSLRGHKPLLVVIKCIYLPPTYRHFMQDIEDMCLLLMSSTSFIDLPFQEHQMMEKHHMDQNPYISSLCPKPGVVSDNMTRGDDVAKSPCPTEPRWGQLAPLLGRPARVWRQRNYTFDTCHVKSVRRGSEVGKSVWP